MPPKRRKNEKETVVKTFLSSFIRNPEHKSTISRAIQLRVLAYSSRLRAASLGLNLIVKELFDGKEDVCTVEVPEYLFDQTFIKNMMMVDKKNSEVKHPIVKEFCRKYPNFLSSPPPYQGQTNIYIAGARQYITNMKNHLKFNLERFMLRVCRAHPTWTESEAIGITKCIRGYALQNFPVPQTEEARQYIQEHRRVLGFESDEVLSEWWIDENMPTILRYFVYLGRVLEDFIVRSPQGENQEETDKLRAQRIGKRFDLLPICKTKAHFITIDIRVVYHILKRYDLFKGSEKDFRKKQRSNWYRFFNIKPLLSKDCIFTGTIQSDGVSVCVHMVKRVSLSEPPQVRYKRGDWVAAVDPGKNSIMHISITKPDDPSLKPRELKITKGQYHAEVGTKKANITSNKWNAHIREALEGVSTVSSRGVSFEDFKHFLNIRKLYEKPIRNEHTKKRWAIQRMRLYSNKQRVYARFFNRLESIVKEESGSSSPPLKVAYGSARFNPARPGSVATPTTAAFKACRARFPTALVHEHRTSFIHHKYRCPLTQVQSVKGTERRVLRGLLWCDSTSSTFSKHFVNRDFNAAMNIMRCFVSPTRPIELSWGNPPIEKRVGCTIQDTPKKQKVDHRVGDVTFATNSTLPT